MANVQGPGGSDTNKALGAGAATLFGGALAKIIIRVLNYKWPGLLDPNMTDGIDDLAVAGMAYYGAYFVPHSKG